MAPLYYHALQMFLEGMVGIFAVLVGAWLLVLVIMSTRPMLNCFIVAIAMWFDGGCRQYLWTRRSRSCRGLLPHFGTAQQLPGRTVRVIEYIPPRSGAVDGVIVFQGEYRVWHMKLVNVKRFLNRAEALAYVPE